MSLSIQGRLRNYSSQSAAECCSVLQCVAVLCSVLQCVAEFCSALQCVAVRSDVCATHCNTLQHTATHCNTLQHTDVMCCSEVDVQQIYIDCMSTRHLIRCSTTQNIHCTCNIHELHIHCTTIQDNTSAIQPLRCKP